RDAPTAVQVRKTRLARLARVNMNQPSPAVTSAFSVDSSGGSRTIARSCDGGQRVAADPYPPASPTPGFLLSGCSYGPAVFSVPGMIKRFSPTAVGRWSTRRPVLAIAAWLTFVVVAV